MITEYSLSKKIKSIKTKYFYVELLELANSKYQVNYESQGETYYSVDIIALDLALEMFTDVLVMIEGN